MLTPPLTPTRTSHARTHLTLDAGLVSPDRVQVQELGQKLRVHDSHLLEHRMCDREVTGTTRLVQQASFNRIVTRDILTHFLLIAMLVDTLACTFTHWQCHPYPLTHTLSTISTHTHTVHLSCVFSVGAGCLTGAALAAKTGDPKVTRGP